MKSVGGIVLILIFGIAFSKADAQVLKSSTGFPLGEEGNFSITLSPKFPRPGTQVKAAVTTFRFDVDRAFITWVLDGKKIAEGTGVKEVLFEVGSLGSENILRVAAVPQEGVKIEKTSKIRPQDIDLIIQPKSFVPPWYKGRALVTPGSPVEVVAFPHFVFEGSPLNPETLVYDWKVDDEVRGDLSGKGKRKLRLHAPTVSSAKTKIVVRVSSPFQTLEHEAETFVETKKPELLFYERRPLEGLITSQALVLKGVTAGSNLEIEAVPFFMNFQSTEHLRFLWNFEGERVEPNPRQPNVFLLKSMAGRKGNAEIQLVITNVKNILERLNSSFSVYAR